MVKRVRSLLLTTTLLTDTSWPFTATVNAEAGRLVCTGSLMTKVIWVPSNEMPPTSVGAIRSAGSVVTLALFTFSVSVAVLALSSASVCDRLPAKSTVRTTRVWSPCTSSEPV